MAFTSETKLDVEFEGKSVTGDNNVDHFEDLSESFDADPDLERKVLWKLDLLLMPLMSLLFLFLFLDRANIGNARVAGLQKAIHATDYQYQLGKSVCALISIIVRLTFLFQPS